MKMSGGQIFVEVPVGKPAIDLLWFSFMYIISKPKTHEISILGTSIFVSPPWRDIGIQNSVVVVVGVSVVVVSVVVVTTQPG
jgi:hypothetical protein